MTDKKNLKPFVFNKEKHTIKEYPINMNKMKILDLRTFGNNMTNDTKEAYHFNKKINEEPETRTDKILIFPTHDQKEILNKWFKICNYIYNLTVNYLKESNYKVTKYFKVQSIIKLRFRTDEKYSEMYKLSILSKIPSHTIDKSIKSVCVAFKSAMTNYNNKNIKRFRLRCLKDNSKISTLALESSAFSKKSNAFAINILGEMQSYTPIKNITRDCKLQMHIIDKNDHSKNEYFLFVPFDRVVKQKHMEVANPETRVCALDPGERTFQVVYATSGITHLGYGNGVIKYKNEKGIMKIILSPLKKKINKIIKLHNKVFNESFTSEVRNKYKKAYEKYVKKLKNTIKDMHHKTAIYLCERYDIIYVGNLSAKSIVANSGNLRAVTKQSIHALSHYKFRQILEQKTKEYGCTVKYVCEAYTSKTCGGCGVKNEKLGGSKVFKCSNCGFKIDRDVNGARNILMKHHPTKV